MKKVLLIAFTLIVIGCSVSAYLKTDFNHSTFICKTFYGQFPVKNIIELSDSSYTYSFLGGRINGSGTWQISPDNDKIILDGNEYYKSFSAINTGKRVKLVMQIKNRTTLINGKDIYKRK